MPTSTSNSSWVTWEEPFKAFRFLIQVVGNEEISGAFSACSGIKMRVETVPFRSGSEKRGVKDTAQGLTSFENITLRRGVIGDNELLEWILSTMASDTAPPTGVNFSRDINVIALDDRGNQGIIWTLVGAKPVSYEVSEFDASQSALISESVEFEVCGVKRITNKPPTNTTGVATGTTIQR